MKKFSLGLIFLMAFAQCFAFGAFNLLNGRNHPELKWQEISSPHVTIIYHTPLDSIAQQALQISENAYESLAKSYGINPSKKILIYISDQDNIANGVTVFTEYIFIWVNQNDYLKYFTGNDKWLRKVLSHELSHWFLASASSDILTPFIPLSDLTFPRDINEGYAQFFSGEKWGYNRGDRYLRDAVYSDKPGYGFANDGGLMYAKGFAMVKYIKEFYGEDKLRDVLKWRTKQKMFDFKKAFKATFHKDYDAFLEEWRSYTYTYYYGMTYTQNSALKTDSLNSLAPNKINFLNKSYASINDISFSGNKYIASARKDKDQYYTQLLTGEFLPDSLAKNKFKTKKEKMIMRAGSFTNLDLSPNAQNAVFTRYIRFKHGSLAPCVYSYDLIKQKMQKIGKGNFPQITDAGWIVYHSYNLVYNRIVISKKGITETFLDLPKDTQVGELELNDDNKTLAISLFDENKAFKICLYDLNSKQKVNEYTFDCMPMNLLWGFDNLYVSIENSKSAKLNLFQFSLDGTKKEFICPEYNITPLKIISQDDSLKIVAKAELGRGADKIIKISLSAGTDSYSSPIDNYYSKWVNASYSNPIENKEISNANLTKKEYSPFLYFKPRTTMLYLLYPDFIFSTTISEPLGKHILSLNLMSPYSTSKMKDASYLLYYQNSSFYPTISFTLLKTHWFAAFTKEKTYYETSNSASLGINFPFDKLNLPFWSFNYGFSLLYENVRLDKPATDIVFENGKAITAEAGLYLNYELPWLNSFYHPVRKLDFQYQISGANKDLGMKKDYISHHLKSETAWAPLLESNTNRFLKTVSLRNNTNLEIVNGNFLAQMMPGSNKYENWITDLSSMFHRTTLRGFDEQSICRRMLNVQNELWLKLVDDLGVSVSVQTPFIYLSYLGSGVWLDYNKLYQDVSSGKDRELKAMGYEFKGGISLFGLPTTQSFGYAYDLKGKKLGGYYLLQFPLSK